MSDFSDLENELKKLRPARPSPVLFARIEEAMVNSESAKIIRPDRFRVNYAALGFGLAAAAVLLLLAKVNTCNSPTARSNRCGAFVIRRSRRGSGVTPRLAHRSASLTPAKKSSSFQFPANDSTKQNHENKTHHHHRSHRFPALRRICANTTLTPSVPFPARFASTARCPGTAGSP